MSDERRGMGCGCLDRCFGCGHEAELMYRL